MQFPVFTERCPEGVLELSFTVESCRTDSYGRMPPHVLAKVMESAAKRQMEICGWGRETVERTNVTWVVGWTSIQIKRLPRSEEQLLVRIWPGRKKLSMQVRKYAFFTDRGETLVSAAVLFLPMDRRDRKLTLAAEALSLPEVVVPGEADIPSLNRVFPDELPCQHERVVCAHEIDENGHMNNTCYLQWAEELCGEYFLRRHEPRSIWIQYINELTEGQTAALEYAAAEQCLFVRGTANQADSFRVVIEYESCDSLATDRGCSQYLEPQQSKGRTD